MKDAGFADPKIAERPKDSLIVVTCALGGQAARSQGACRLRIYQCQGRRRWLRRMEGCRHLSCASRRLWTRIVTQIIFALVVSGLLVACRIGDFSPRG